MKALATLLIISLAISSFTFNSIDTREDIIWLNGSWAGLGYQPQLEKPWTIELDCNVDKKKFVIKYPSLNCQGFWKIEEAGSNRIVFKEKIAKGDHTCIPKGMVIVTKVDASHISYSYFETIDAQYVLNSFSTLKRVK
jgi:hypothetical protein